MRKPKANSNSISAFDRATVRMFSAEVDAALAALAQKYGVEIAPCRASYMSDRCKFSVEVNVAGAGSKEAQEYEAFASLYGLERSWLNKQVIFAGKPYKLCGLKRGGQSVLVQNDAGKLYRVKVEVFKRAAKLA